MILLNIKFGFTANGSTQAIRMKNAANAWRTVKQDKEVMQPLQEQAKKANQEKKTELLDLSEEKKGQYRMKMEQQVLATLVL